MLRPSLEGKVDSLWSNTVNLSGAEHEVKVLRPSGGQDVPRTEILTISWGRGVQSMRPRC